MLINLTGHAGVEQIITFSFAPMLTKAQVKDIRSLAEQKYRREKRAYIIEGDKMAREWLNSRADIRQIFALKEWAANNSLLIDRQQQAVTTIIEPHELEKISTLRTPNSALLVVNFPAHQQAPPVDEWCIALDKIQDPGNMGTIIRIADWYGINHVIASPDSADFYNPKVLQSAMGGHLRVQLHTAELPVFLKKATIPVLAAALDGRNMYELPKQEAAVLLIGNESKGLSDEVLSMATEKISIPRRGGAESLNAAVAAGIICATCMPQ